MMKARREHLLVLFVLLATALVFAPGVFGDFVWDDWPLIVRNRYVRDPSHLAHVLTSSFWDVSSRAGVGRLAYLNLYRPVVSLAYVTQFQLFGENALGYHLVSLALHLACVLLAFVWLRNRLPAVAAAPVAATAGIVPFAIHPSRPEVVTWISGCTDLWMTFWSLLGVVALAQPRLSTRVLGGLSIGLAVLSKEAAVFVPVLLVCDALFIERRRPALSREGVGAAGAILAIVIHLVVVPPGRESRDFTDVVQRVSATLGHFVVRTVWPFDPSVEPVPRMFDSAGREIFAPWSIALGAAFVLAIAALAVLAWRRSKLRPWLADALWFLLPLLPVSNLVALSGPTVVADRYLFMPMLGISALLARALLPLIEAGPPRRTAVVAGAAALAIGCGAMAASHAQHFASDEALWTGEYERNPDSLSAISSLSRQALEADDGARALSLLLHARNVSEARHDASGAASYALRAVSTLLYRCSDAEQEKLRHIRDFYARFEDEPHLRITLPELDLDNRVPPDAWHLLRTRVDTVRLPLATAQARTGDLPAAQETLRGILAENPRVVGAWNLSIAVFARQGNWDAARAAHAEAAQRVPGDASVTAMGEALARASILAAQRAEDPIAAAVRDASVQTSLGAPQAAREILDAALREYPGHPLLVMERARADVADARFDLARDVLERARATDSANSARWEHALQQLDAAEAEAARRRRSRAAGGSEAWPDDE